MRFGSILGRFVLREVVLAGLVVSGVLLIMLLANEVLGRGIEVRPSARLPHSRDRAERAELHWHISMPVTCLLLALHAVPLSKLRPRQGGPGLITRLRERMRGL
ncbi:MAG TPA: LptF/LptG family permease [Steroidobacteraceae bacterium]